MNRIAVLLTLCAVALGGCVDDIEPTATSPATVVHYGYGVPMVPPPPPFVPTTSGTCTQDDTSGCAARCADGDAEACSHEPAAEGSTPEAWVDPRLAWQGAPSVVQFFGPVGSVSMTQGAPAARP